MYTVFIFNNESNRLERYRLEPYHNMPYTSFSSLSVSDFFAGSISTVGWSTSLFMNHWSSFSRGLIKTSCFFRRTFEGGHITQSMHYVGMAADISSDIKSHSLYSGPNHIGLSPRGYPTLSPGNIGVFVLVLQDILCTLGYCDGSLDGFFGPATTRALNRFKSSVNLPHDSLCDRITWDKLSFLCTSCGITNTTFYIKKPPGFYCTRSDR